MFGLKLDTGFDFYILFIILIKMVFVVAAIGHVILSHTNTRLDKYDAKLVYWKERTEFVFVLTMALLLIYHFNPRFHSKPMSGETKLLFFLFGWVLLITAKWDIFIKESPWYEKISAAFN
jgi:hypothetical protein